MEQDKAQLSELAQQALAAYNIIEYIRALNQNQNRFTYPHNHSFKQQLIDNHVVDPNVVTMKNFNKVIKLFTLKHDMNPSTPFLDFAGTHYKTMENIEAHEYCPTETTKTLFNIVLNRKRKSVVLGNFGLTRNIVVYLLWHLSNIIIDFRMLEDVKEMQPFVEMERFLSIPKILYYELRDQEEIKIIQHLKNQCLEIDFNCKRANLMKFCSKLQKQHEDRNIQVFYIILSAENSPEELLAQLGKMKTNGEHQSPSISNAYKILFNDKQKFVRPQFLMKERFGDVGLTYKIDEFRPERRLSYIKSQKTFSVQKFESGKQFCKSSNRLINFQRTYFLLRKRQAYANNLRKTRYSRKWMIKNVRKVYKEMCVLMHDDEQSYKRYEGEIDLIDKLTAQQSVGFSQLESHFIRRSLDQVANRDQTAVYLPNVFQSTMFYFQTQHVTNDLSLRLKIMKEYVSLAISTKDDFVRQFRLIMHHLMSCYPQKFTFLLNGEPLKIKTEHNSTFLAINKDHKIVNLDTHLERILPQVDRLGLTSYYLSACSGLSTEGSCFDHILLKWDANQKYYDLKVIEWVFSKQVEDYWTQSSSGQLQLPNKPQDTIIVDESRYIPIIQRVIDIEKRVQTDLNIRRQHFVICPQKIINLLKGNKQLKKYYIKGPRKWRIFLAAIEDVRLTEFSFHEVYLTSIVNQLFENITILKRLSENKKK